RAAPGRSCRAMNALHLVRGLAENNAWSNMRLYRACEQLSSDELDAPRTSFFPSIRETLDHILTVDRYYIDALTRGDRGPRLLEPKAMHAGFDRFREHWAARKRLDATLVAFVHELADEAALDAIVDL